MENKKSVYSVKAFRYGMTNGFSTLLTTVASTYWAYFLTKAVGLETAVMATILTLSSTVDLICIPICAVLLQKSNLPGGKFRPWLLIGGVGAGLFRWLSFTDLGLTGTGQAIWFAGTYILTYILFNLAYSSFNGILPLMAKTPNDRVAFSSARVTCNSIGKFLFSISSVSLIAIFGKNSETLGYSLFALLIGILVILGFVQLFVLTKDVDVVKKTKDISGKVNDQYDASFFQMLKYTISVPFLLFLLASICKGTTFLLILGLAPYYYNYVVQDMSMLTAYLSVSTFLMIGGAFVTPFINKFFKGSRNLFLLGMIIYGASLGSAFIFGKTGFSFTIIMCLGYIGFSFSHASEVALYTEVVQYTQWKHDKDLKPFMMTLFQLTPKIGTVVGSAVLGFGLVAIGFSESNITEQAVNGIRILLSGLPAALVAISTVALFLNPLSEKRVNEIQNELTAREALKTKEA